MLAVSMKVLSGEQFDDWEVGVILVDGYQVKYVYPGNAFFYKEPKKNAVLMVRCMLISQTLFMNDPFLLDGSLLAYIFKK